MAASVADVMAYDALDPALKAAIERVWADRVQENVDEQIRDAYSEGHAEGYEEGHKDGYDEGFEDAEEKLYNDRLDSLCSKCGSDVSACFNCANTTDTTE